MSTAKAGYHIVSQLSTIFIFRTTHTWTIIFHFSIRFKTVQLPGTHCNLWWTLWPLSPSQNILKIYVDEIISDNISNFRFSYFKILGHYASGSQLHVSLHSYREQRLRNILKWKSLYHVWTVNSPLAGTLLLSQITVKSYRCMWSIRAISFLDLWHFSKFILILINPCLLQSATNS